MMNSLSRPTARRATSTVMFVLVLAAIAYWRWHDSEPSIEAIVATRAQVTDEAVLETDSTDDLRAVTDTDHVSLTDSGESKIEPLDSYPDDVGFEAPKQEIAPSPQREPYTWRDGDRTIQVWFDPKLAVQSDGDNLSRENIVASVGDDAKVGRASASALHGGGPVFWSNSGELMALPGGVVIVLDPSWAADEVHSFFERNGVDATRVSELDFVANGFYIDTEPGFASLDLANALAAQPGVELSSPDWWIERVAK